jgi:hypothetical protein
MSWRLEWKDGELLLLCGKELVAKRQGDQWTTFMPVIVTDLLNGAVSVTSISYKEWREQSCYTSKKEVRWWQEKGTK